MTIKYTNHFLNKLEDLFSESNYILRYEKGNFKSGFCILHSTHVVVVNKYYTVEGKINCLLEILKTIEIDTSAFGEKNHKFFLELSQIELEL